MIKLFLTTAAANGLLAVALGAFGAHGLRDKLTPELFSAYQTAVQYHFYHTFALLAVGLMLLHWQHKPLLIASGFSFMLGLCLFCGSLYWMAIGGPRWLGPVTPLGGLAFLAGWCLLLIAVVRA